MAKLPADLRSLARAHTELSVQTLAGIARNSTSDQARVAAAQALLDRGWGKAPQTHMAESGGDLHVVIRNITDFSMPHCELGSADGVGPDLLTVKRLAAK
jgi:hypothetical protein